jgi:hypothetical protein
MMHAAELGARGGVVEALATSRKVAVSIPDGVIGISAALWPWG